MMKDQRQPDFWRDAPHEVEREEGDADEGLEGVDPGPALVQVAVLGVQEAEEQDGREADARDEVGEHDDERVGHEDQARVQLQRLEEPPHVQEWRRRLGQVHHLTDRGQRP